MYIQWPNDKPKRLYDSRTDNHLMLSSDYLEPLTHLSDIMIGEKKRKRFSSVRHRLRSRTRRGRTRRPDKCLRNLKVMRPRMQRYVTPTGCFHDSAERNDPPTAGGRVAAWRTVWCPSQPP